jgi:hypothetical protein
MAFGVQNQASNPLLDYRLVDKIFNQELVMKNLRTTELYEFFSFFSEFSIPNLGSTNVCAGQCL